VDHKSKGYCYDKLATRAGAIIIKPDKPIGLFWAYFGLFNRLFNGLCNGLLMDFY